VSKSEHVTDSLSRDVLFKEANHFVRRKQMNDSQDYSRIVIAGVSSGVGKTSLTMALIADLRSRGLRVQPFKVGPDYIDPSHLAQAAGRPCYNLDTWMVSKPRMLDLFTSTASSADISIIEGVMGLYDGHSSTSEIGSTAEVAKLLNAPVILVIDAGAMARSAAAVVLGFQHLDPRVNIVGVIANRVGGEGHANLLREAIEPATGIPLLGYLTHNPDITLPERHLGLVPTSERKIDPTHLAALAERFRATCQSERILELARQAPPLEHHISKEFHIAEDTKPDVPIAIAQDEAFNFYYPDTLDLLRKAGARLILFSPLHDERVPEDIYGLYFGGGFPEEYAQGLTANGSMREDIARLIGQDIPCYAECGGLMYLCRSIRLASGEELPMVGAIERESSMNKGAYGLVIGYREAESLQDTLLTRKGEVVRGHEFHYSSLDRPFSREAAAYQLTPGDRVEGIVKGNLLATYVHLPFSGFPVAAQRFVQAAQSWKDAQNVSL
jgi:cobyrinic acid a,c-diamide synthase